jgi:hypothetical protein
MYRYCPSLSDLEAYEVYLEGRPQDSVHGKHICICPTESLARLICDSLNACWAMGETLEKLLPKGLYRAS